MRFLVRPRRSRNEVWWITDDLAVASTSGDSADSTATDAQVVFDLRTRREGGGGPRTPGADSALRWMPVEDGAAPALHDLAEAGSWLAAQIGSGRRVLITCREGRGRSALLACATLMALGYSLEDAYRVVRRGQPRVALSDGQIRVLEELSGTDA